MRNLPLLLFGVLLFSLFIGCHYDEIPIDGPVNPCDNPANPSCCDEPNNTNCCPDPSGCDPCDDPTILHCCETNDVQPCCNSMPLPDICNPEPIYTTFDTLILKSNPEINCNDLDIREIKELPDGKGYVIVGRCSGKGAIIHIDTLGTIVCAEVNLSNEPDFSFFNSVVVSNSDKILTTGYTLNTFNTSGYNAIFSNNNYCVEQNQFDLDAGPNAAEKWDQGNSIVKGLNNNNIIIGGKWRGFPTLFVMEDESDLGTSGIIDTNILDEDDFTGVSLAPVGTSPVPGHEVTKVVPTNDGGFLMTGHVDIEDSGVFKRKVFVAKMNSNIQQVTVKTYDEIDLPITNTFGLDIVQTNQGIFFAVVGVGFDSQLPQNLAGASFPQDYPQADFDGFILLVNSSGLEYRDLFKWDVNGMKDLINSSVEKNEDELSDFIIAGSTQSSNNEVKVTLRDFTTLGFDIVQGNEINSTIGDDNQFTEAKDIIITEDGGYVIISNVSSTSSNSLGFRVTKTDPDGNF